MQADDNVEEGVDSADGRVTLPWSWRDLQIHTNSEDVVHETVAEFALWETEDACFECVSKTDIVEKGRESCSVEGDGGVEQIMIRVRVEVEIVTCDGRFRCSCEGSPSRTDAECISAPVEFFHAEERLTEKLRGGCSRSLWVVEVVLEGRSDDIFGSDLVFHIHVRADPAEVLVAGFADGAGELGVLVVIHIEVHIDVGFCVVECFDSLCCEGVETVLLNVRSRCGADEGDDDGGDYEEETLPQGRQRWNV